METYSDILPRDNEDRDPFAICTIVDRKGATPRKTGAKMLVYGNGKITGSIGGGNLEKTVIADAIRVLSKKEPELFRHDLLHQHSMCCGGTVWVYIEPQIMRKRLFIFGAGHTGKALSELAEGFGFDIFVIDPRKEIMNELTVPGLNKMCIDHQLALQALVFDEDSYICIMTHDHAIDRAILSSCISKPHAYLGMIGSQRKVEVTIKMFLQSGIATEDELNDVDMPMGIEIGAEGAREIALSILSKLIAVRNNVDA